MQKEAKFPPGYKTGLVLAFASREKKTLCTLFKDWRCSSASGTFLTHFIIVLFLEVHKNKSEI